MRSPRTLSIATSGWRRLIAVATACLPWLYLPATHAATITTQTTTIAGTSRTQPQFVHTLRLTGMIETGDADKLHEILSKLPTSRATSVDLPLTIVELSSLGGSLPEGFQLGQLFRKFKVVAVVRKQDLCLSSCALAFLGGNVHRLPSIYPANCNIEIGGKVAFHNFWLNRNGLREVTSEDPVASRLQGFTDARGAAALLVKYAGEMGLPPNFVASLIGRPVEDFQYIETVAQFLSFHVCPIGLGRPSIALEAQAINVCNNSTGEHNRTPPLQVRAIPTPQAKLYLLERVQANMQSSRAKGRLAAQLASGAVMRVQQEIDRLYDDLIAAGVAIPDIVGPTFEVSRKAAGADEVICYVSLSTDDPDKFEVVIQTAKGLIQPPNSPPGNCRRLFLFDPKDVINRHDDRRGQLLPGLL